MISIDSEVITAVRDAITEAHGKCFVSGEYLRSVSELPAVSILEMNNYVPTRAIDSGTVENYAEIMYQIDVYSADRSTKKSSARELMKTADEVMIGMGFRRISLNPLPNVNNATIFRMTARYQAVVTKEGYIAR